LISTSDILRNASKTSADGNMKLDISKEMKMGKLVDDNKVSQIMHTELKKI
jgi:adenylate kinase family enzyme